MAWGLFDGSRPTSEPTEYLIELVTGSEVWFYLVPVQHTIVALDYIVTEHGTSQAARFVTIYEVLRHCSGFLQFAKVLFQILLSHVHHLVMCKV